MVTFTVEPGGNVTTGAIMLGINNSNPIYNQPNYLAFDGTGGTWNVDGCIKGWYNNTTTPQIVGLRVMHLHVHDMSASSCTPIKVGNIRDVQIVGNDVGPGCCNTDGIVLGNRLGGPQNDDVVIEGNYIHDLYDTCSRVQVAVIAQYGCSGQGFGDPCGLPCQQSEHADAIQAFTAWNTTVRNNRIDTINPGGAAQGIFFQPAVCNAPCFGNITYEGNLIGAIGTLSAGISAPGNSQVAGYFNVLYNTINGLFRLDNSSTSHMMAPGSTVRVVGNVIASASPGICSPTAGDGSRVTLVWSNNQVGGSSFDCNPATDRVGAPTYVRRTGYNPDLHLSGLQWAVDRGEGTYCPPLDIDGDQRPQAAACDVGADELGATPPPQVRDTIAPTLGLPPNQAAEATASAGAIVSFTPTAWDAVDPAPAVSCKPLSGSGFPFGTTIVACTATDATGNTSTGSFTITVRDTIAPTAPGNPTPSNVTRTSDDLSWLASTDAVGTTGYNLWLDGVPAGSTSSLRFTFAGLACGTAHTLTVAAHDAAGNQSQQGSAYVSTLSCPSPSPTPTPTDTPTTTTTTTPEASSPTPRKLAVLNSVASPAMAKQTLAISDVRAGDTVIVVVFGNANQPSSVRDSLGNTYVLDAASGAANPLSSTSIYRYRYAAAQSSLTLSVNWSDEIAHQQVAVYAIPSLLALDARVASGAKSATPSISAPSTTKRNEVAIAAFRVMESNWVGSGLPPAGWTVLTSVLAPSGNGHMIVAYRPLPTTGSVSFGFSLGATASNWSAALTTYAGG